MSPVTSPGQALRSAGRADPAAVRFRRAVTLMLMTLLVPGSAQLAAGGPREKALGRIALRVWLGLIALALLVVGVGMLSRGFVFWMVSSTFVLGLVKFGLMILAVGWAYLFVDAWRLGDPLKMRQKQRLAMVGINFVLCFSVAGSLLFASHVVSVQKDFIGSMFASATVSDAHAGRYNVLLLGGDSGVTRWGMRPDSLTVASIDAETGSTVLFGLPRNMQNFPFAEGSVMAEQFPNGFDCEHCELNSLFTWAMDNQELFEGSANPGVEATKQAVEGITGLPINYYAMVNMKGFRHLVDAVGGVELNVRDRIPKGALGDFDGEYIEPGVQRLNGEDTLWFARSRMEADDYSRMARQKCVMSAMLTQLNPQTAVLRFGEIAKASKSMVSTDVPASDLDTFMDLALKARAKPLRTVSFVPPLIETYQPDIDLIHERVEKAIDRAEGTSKPTKATAPATGGTAEEATVSTGGSVGTMKEGYAANQAEDLSGAC
ncbi:hypothetical protein GCM10027425_32180 [Alteromonas gracilis]